MAKGWDWVAVVSGLFLAGCRFDPSGIAPWPAPDSPRPRDILDGPAKADLSVPDHPPPPDGPLLPDGPLPDTGGVVPITAAALGQALDAALVPCVDKNGVDKGFNTKIVDSPTVKLVDGSATLPGAPNDTLSWASKHKLVTIVFNPDACDEEYPGRSDWAHAGLLVRKASLDGLGRMVLEPKTSEKDLNLLNVQSDGSFEGKTDFAKPDDSKLADTPQLVNPIGKAKQIVIQLGQP